MGYVFFIASVFYVAMFVYIHGSVLFQKENKLIYAHIFSLSSFPKAQNTEPVVKRRKKQNTAVDKRKGFKTAVSGTWIKQFSVERIFFCVLGLFLKKNFFFVRREPSS